MFSLSAFLRFLLPLSILLLLGEHNSLFSKVASCKALCAPILDPRPSGPLSHGFSRSWRLRLLTLSHCSLVGSLQPWWSRLQPGLYTAGHSLLNLPLTLTSSSPAPFWPFHRPCWVSWKRTSYLWLGDSSGKPPSLVIMTEPYASHDASKIELRRQWKPLPTIIKEKEPLWYRVL